MEKLRDNQEVESGEANVLQQMAATANANAADRGDEVIKGISDLKSTFASKFN